MKRRQLLWMTLLGVLGLILGTSMTMTASAKYAGHSATPTELRGTWYQYQGHHKWEKIVITKHAFKINGKTLYTPYKKSWHKLYVLHEKKGCGGSNYVLNGKFKYGYQNLGTFWLSARKVKGHRVMKSYYNMKYFSVYTHQKLKHNYSYEYKGSQYMNQIGR